MIFRDLIQPEEFYDGCKVYSQYPIFEEFIITQALDTLYPLRRAENSSSSFTHTGMKYHLYFYSDKRIYFKELLCNKSRRIIPTKYKHL